MIRVDVVDCGLSHLRCLYTKTLWCQTFLADLQEMWTLLEERKKAAGCAVSTWKQWRRDGDGWRMEMACECFGLENSWLYFQNDENIWWYIRFKFSFYWQHISFHSMLARVSNVETSTSRIRAFNIGDSFLVFGLLCWDAICGSQFHENCNRWLRRSRSSIHAYTNAYYMYSLIGMHSFILIDVCSMQMQYVLAFEFHVGVEHRQSYIVRDLCSLR